MNILSLVCLDDMNIKRKQQTNFTNLTFHEEGNNINSIFVSSQPVHMRFWHEEKNSFRKAPVWVLKTYLLCINKTERSYLGL